MVKTEEFKDWNERMVRKFDPDAFHHHPNPFIRLIEGRRVRLIIKLLNSREGDLVLEVGCGAGNILEAISKGKRFGLDLSEFILNKAKDKLKSDVNLLRADAQNLPFKEGMFSRIVCSEVLEHIMDPSAALREIAKALHPEGIAVLSVPNELWINRIKQILVRLRLFRWFLNRSGDYRQMPERMDDEWHLRSLSLEEWKLLFEKFFEVTRVKRVAFLWIPIRYVLQLQKSR